MHANKLHINMKKCCYMHFKPKIGTSDGDQDNNNQRTRLYTRYPIVARALGLAAFRPSARASKGILHTTY